MHNWMMLILCLLVLLLVTLWYRYGYAPYQLLKRLGIPHPPVIPFFGNALEINKSDTLKAIEKWGKEYGKIFGCYVGSSAYIIVADLDIVKEIAVRRNDNFLALAEETSLWKYIRIDDKVGRGLFFERGEEWKRIRSIVSPTFSSKKLKIMTPLLEKICEEFCDKLENISAKGASVDVNKLCGQLTMEAILSAIFASRADLLKEEDNTLTKAANGIFGFASDRFFLWTYVFNSHFPFLMDFIGYICSKVLQLSHTYNYLHGFFLEIVRKRKEQKERSSMMHKDFLQLLIDSRSGDNENNSLTDGEIVAVGVDLLLAGYETTKTALTFTLYLLALNPDKQELLCEAIDNYYQENEDATLYDASQSIPYLDWVIQESLRLHPPAPWMRRTCTKTCSINGITFPEGMKIIIPSKYIHYLSENYDQPEIFEPNRFSPEGKEGRNPLCHLPFGWGPRICIGMRFALMDAKMALVCILKKYKFVRGPDTQVPLELVLGITEVPKDGAYLKVVKRI